MFLCHLRQQSSLLKKKKKKEEIIIKVKVIPKLLQGTCICTHEILTESV